MRINLHLRPPTPNFRRGPQQLVRCLTLGPQPVHLEARWLATYALRTIALLFPSHSPAASQRSCCRFFFSPANFALAKFATLGQRIVSESCWTLQRASQQTQLQCNCPIDSHSNANSNLNLNSERAFAMLLFASICVSLVFGGLLARQQIHMLLH